MVRDKAALRGWLAGEFAAAPPRFLIPAHGEIVDAAADPDALRKRLSPAAGT
jgi:hypothetical protein